MKGILRNDGRDIKIAFFLLLINMWNIEQWNLIKLLKNILSLTQLVYSINASVKHLLGAQAKLCQECEPGIHNPYNQDCSQPKHCTLILIVK